MNKKLAAIIVAGGTGSRMGTDIPKQFLDLNGKEIISYTLDTFARCSFIDKIIIVCHKDYLNHCLNLVKKISKEVKVVAGSETRQQSVYNGLLEASDCEHVMIHDAVRCLITEDDISKLHKNLLLCGSCTLAVRAKDTIKLSDENNIVSKTLSREKLWHIQTPQAFLTKEITSAHEYALEKEFIGTDDCSVMENAGGKIKLVEGSYENIKITTPSDLEIAKVFLKGRELL